ncbi:MAG: VWA domain-containing protein [Acidobacteria bacterium]|nr:VWA domain-containing protein [Acidobacteriota bacterium]
MPRNFALTLLMLAVASAGASYAVRTYGIPAGSVNKMTPSGSRGPAALQVIGRTGKVSGLCPLKHTEVKAEISGFISRVSVRQEFENPFKEKIEAVYTFPLPQNAAVDDMVLTVGERTIRGKIKTREDARAAYEAARNTGQVASLLDQERPNIFTQSVTNIMPGEQVSVTLSFVETLKYEDGSYEFMFPMVVGPRYIPGGSGKPRQPGQRAADTDQVPDASRITPPVTPEGARAGHDLSIEVVLDAGVPIQELRSTLHEIDVHRPDAHSAVVRLREGSIIPNKDFILKYDVAGERVNDALLSHRSAKGGFFTLILQPPERVNVEDVTPKELVFVLDTSGSMSGFPIEKAKETMKLALEGLYPQDTFNLITFAGDTRILFPAPVPATPANLQRAQEFVASREGGGGTEMMKAIRAALDASDAQDPIRIVCFMTDGFVGNDMEIISEVQKHSNARVFSFGIGSSVNRFLLDKMAEHGRGEVEYVTLQDDGSAAARRFHERVRNPLLTDLAVDWSGMPVADVYPERIPDLFSAKPVILSGRYTGPWNGSIQLKGKSAGRAFSRHLAVVMPEARPDHGGLATLWARKRVDDLMSQDFEGIQTGNPRIDIREMITRTGLEYRLMTQFTSFVAVEEMNVTDGGVPRVIDVPVEMPEGVSYKGVFGTREYGEGQSLSAGYPTMGAVATNEAASGVPVRISGGAGGGVGVAAAPSHSGIKLDKRRGGRDGESDLLQQVSPEEAKRRTILAKLHPSIAALIDRLKRNVTVPGEQESRSVRGGKAEVQVSLADKSSRVLLQLKRLGFETILDPKNSRLIIGRLPIGNLSRLAELESVRYITPN